MNSNAVQSTTPAGGGLISQLQQLQHVNSSKTQGRPFNPNGKMLMTGRDNNNSKFDKSLGGYLNCQSI